MQVFFQDILCIIIFFANHSYNEKRLLFLIVNVVNVWNNFFKVPYFTLKNQNILFAWIFPPLALLNIVWKMESFSGNENKLIQNEGCEMFMNEAKYKDKVMEEIQENLSLQIKENKVLTNDEKNMKQNLKLLHSQREKWRPHNRNALCWPFFYLNDNAKWHLIYFKSCVNNCMLCYSNPMFSFNPRMKLKKGLIFYYTKME